MPHRPHHALKRWLVALALPLLCSQVQAREWTEVRFGINPEYPPFESVAVDGSLQGFDVELGNALCQKLQITCTWVTGDFDSLIPALRARRSDAILSSIAVTEARLRQIDFTDKLYLSPTAIISRTDAPLDTQAGTLKGKRIGVLQGSLQEAYARAKLAPQGARVQAYQAQDQTYVDLVNGRLDGLVTDQLEAELNFLATPRGAGFASTATVKDPSVPSVIAIALRKNDAELKALLNRGIAALHADGTYQAIQRKYFGDLDIYND